MKSVISKQGEKHFCAGGATQHPLNLASISSHADSDLDGNGWGEFDGSLMHPNASAVAAEGNGFDLPELPAFASPNWPVVIVCTALAACLVAIGFAEGGPGEPEAIFEAYADQQAAAEGFHSASSGAQR